MHARCCRDGVPRRLTSALLIVGLLSPTAAAAQSVTGTIFGTVRDATGGAIAGTSAAGALRSPLFRGPARHPRRRQVPVDRTAPSSSTKAFQTLTLDGATPAEVLTRKSPRDAPGHRIIPALGRSRTEAASRSEAASDAAREPRCYNPPVSSRSKSISPLRAQSSLRNTLRLRDVLSGEELESEKFESNENSDLPDAGRQ